MYVYIQRKEREFNSRLDTVARLYGVAAAMRLKTEKEILSKVRRVPGLPSSMIALETVLGTDETIDFEDFLNGTCLCVVMSKSIYEPSTERIELCIHSFTD